ncbi:LOW QUALITY PROTEIN: hypothetical protein BCV70DRAFT_212137 [Testicularia cyperi]|uniref:Nuclear pore complex NUP2/50/61 domain-containing protein n=1 Tax=Testicularia cyperi TaxID=1882483 RepID=A0A317XN99_9BASI|nr:LOW QUALITY PROTEIN: hypothetical protein BCV70DRAFT_212137 [Testicularia cyperi]
MDFPSQYPDSPAKPLAGPARSRVLARQNRTSSLKPYSRPSVGNIPASGSSSSLHTNGNAHEDGNTLALPPSTPNHKTLTPTARSPFSPLRAAASPLALLGSVTKIVSKPFSWLTGSMGAAQPELGIPTSSSTGSLSSLARKRAVAQASIKSKADQDPERDAPTLAARAVGERLAAGAGLRTRSTNPQYDEESQLRSPAAAHLPSSASTSRLAPGPSSRRTTLSPAQARLASPPPVPSSLSRSFTFSENLNGEADRPAPWSNRAAKRTLDIGTPAANDSMDTSMDRTRAASPATSAVRSRGMQALRSPRSHAGFQRGSSLRPDDAMSDAGSTISKSNSSYAFGYGNEVRYAASHFGLPPSSSPFQLSARGATLRSRASLGANLFADAATPGRSPRAGSIGLRATSPAASIGYSPARGREGTPQRTSWAGFHLAAPSAASVGDEMMREYLSTRTLPGVNPKIRRSLGLPADDVLPFSSARSAGTASIMDETESITPSRLGKRDVDMSIDGDSERLRTTTGTPSKRRMVWHPELGFISHEELKAREPKLPSPKNEAERLLNVLENMRAPVQRNSQYAGTPVAGPPTSIHVPAPISDPSASSGISRPRTADGKASIQVAPYTRALRKAKSAVPSEAEQGGMRARLKRAPLAKTSIYDEAELDDGAEQDAKMAGSDDEAEQNDQMEEEPETEPSKPEPIRRSRRLQHREPDAAAPATTQLKSALKATPMKPSTGAAVPASETPRPASHRISLSVATASKPAPSADNFSVRTASDPSAPRERSSLRQGAAKTSRTHQSSGKFSAWDEDEEEEDLPDASDLAKIKLPTNLFPSGFAFGGGAATQSSGTSTKTDSQPTTQAAPAAGGSLLGRLGGFDATSKSADEKAEVKAKPSFSFTAPSKDNPSAPNTASTSVPASTTSTSLKDGKKDGPVPNFFGSSMQNSSAEKTDKPASASGFSFGAAAFGAKPAETSASTSSPSMFGGVAFGSKPSKPETTSVEKKASTKPSFFGFTFGAPATSTAGTPSASEQKKDVQPSPSSSFSFGAPKKDEAASGGAPASGSSEPAKPATAPTSSSSTGFSFGKPAEANKTSSSSTASGFSFGAPKTDSAAKPAGFSFGSAKPSSTTADASASGSGATTPTNTFSAPASSTPASAGDAAKPPSSGFSFGSATSSSAGANPSTTSTASGFGGFGGFGTPAAPASGANNSGGEMMDDAAALQGASTSNTPATPSAGASKPPAMSFTFGTPSSSAAPPATGASAGAAASGFRFGSPAPSTGAAPFAFGSTTPAGSAPSSPFLAPQQAPTTPGGSPFHTPGASTGFTFGTPAASPAVPSFGGAAAPNTGFGAPAQQSTPSFGGFGSTTTPQAQPPANAGFTFGSGSGMPSLPSTPAGGPGLFSMGAAPSPAQNSPGGRQIKPLRQRRR